MSVFEKLLLEAPQSVKELLDGLKGLRENPEYHPEPSTFEHVRIVTERLEDTGDADLILTGFFHDLFKLETQVVNEKTGYPSSPLHDKAVAKFIRTTVDVKDFISRNGGDVEKVAFMCEQHMRVKRLGEMRNSKRWSLMKHELFPKLCLFTLADKMPAHEAYNDWKDCFGKWNHRTWRNVLPVGDVTIGWLEEEEKRMAKAGSNSNKHRLSGKDLIDLGYPKGKVVGMAIKAADSKKMDYLEPDELLFYFKVVLHSPETFVNDEFVGEVANELLVSVDADE